jgi:hypothetical protein
VSLLDDLTTRGAEVRARLYELLARHEYPTDTKTVFVIGCVDTALEHHQAIWLLAKSGLHGSAFAFVRLVYDAMFRALWINKCACVEQIEQASRDELQWRMGQVRDDIKQAYFGNASQENAALVDECFERLKKVWSAACSYTHSGALQIGRRFTFDEVKPNYSEGEIAEALNLATMAMLWFLPPLLLSMGFVSEAEEALAVLGKYNADFATRLPRHSMSTK